MGVVFNAHARANGETEEIPVPGVRTVNTNKRRNRKTKTEHVVLVPGVGTLFCTHCGEKYTPAYPIAFNLMSALISAFGKSHKACKLGLRGKGCTYCLNFGHGHVECPRLGYDGDPERWWIGPDTGLSSKTIWRVLMGASLSPADTYAPLDPDDFGRCHRLLHAIPGWRARIGEMVNVPGWQKLALAWDELEALYEEELPKGRAPKLYARMSELAMPTISKGEGQ